MRTRLRETVARERSYRVGKGQHPPSLRAARPNQSSPWPLPTPRGLGTPGSLPPHLGGPRRCRPRATKPARQPRPTAPSPTETPVPSPTAKRPPRPLTQGHVDFVEVLIAAGFRRRRLGRRGSHQPGAEPVHDWSCGVGAVSREGQSRRPAASHSRTQTSCSAERARALGASSPAHPRRREGRGATETNRGPERPTRNWPLAALAGRGLRSRAAASGAVRSRCPSAWTFRTSGSGWTRAPPEPRLKHQPESRLLRKDSTRPSALQSQEAGQTPRSSFARSKSCSDNLVSP